MSVPGCSLNHKDVFISLKILSFHQCGVVYIPYGMPIMNYWAFKKVDVILCKSRAYYWVKKAICILTDITAIINAINSYWAPTLLSTGHIFVTEQNSHAPKSVYIRLYVTTSIKSSLKGCTFHTVLYWYYNLYWVYNPKNKAVFSFGEKVNFDDMFFPRSSGKYCSFFFFSMYREPTVPWPPKINTKI